MSIPILNNLDLNLNQLLNALAQVLATDPVSPTEGQFWYNSASHQLKYFNGTTTVVLYQAATAATASTVVLRDASGDFAAHDITANRVTGLATPTASSDAATKGYADALSTGLDVKASVRVATTANITLSGTQTIDGVSVIAGDRVLVKDQTTGSENGLWTVAAGAWSRATDADTSAEVTSGLYTFVSEGTDNADSGWLLTTNDPIVLGTTALAFTQFSGAGQITAGAGLTKTGNTLDVVGTADRITVNADSIDIAGTYVGQTSITILGTIATGTWSATTIALNKGGTGATTAAGARAALVAPGIYATDVGDASATSFVVTHNLGTRDVVVTVRDNTTPFAVVYADVEATSTTTVTVRFAAAPATNRYRVIIHA